MIWNKECYFILNQVTIEKTKRLFVDVFYHNVSKYSWLHLVFTWPTSIRGRLRPDSRRGLFRSKLVICKAHHAVRTAKHSIQPLLIACWWVSRLAHQDTLKSTPVRCPFSFVRSSSSFFAIFFPFLNLLLVVISVSSVGPNHYYLDFSIAFSITFKPTPWNFFCGSCREIMLCIITNDR